VSTDFHFLNRLMNCKTIIVLLAAAAMLAGCGHESRSNRTLKRRPPMVQTVAVQQRDLVKTVTFTGSVAPVKTARMASPAEGPVTKCAVREGDQVAPNQLLVQVGRDSSATAALVAARDELRQYQSEFTRVARLVEQALLPDAQLDEARSNLRNAQAQVAAMETSESDYRIAAPWSGVVSKVWISEGNYVAPRTPMVELYDPSSMVLRIAVPEKYALAMRTGALVQATLDAYPDKQFLAQIVRIYPELERKTRTVTVEVVINEPIKLMSGMFARVNVGVARVENAFVFPERALVVRPDGGNTIFVVEGETVHEIGVQPVLEADGLVAISNRLKSQARIVVQGNLSLKDGARVKVKAAKGGAKT